MSKGGSDACDTPASRKQPGDGGRCCFQLSQRSQFPFHVAFVDARLPNAVNPFGVHSMKIQKNSILVLGGGHCVPADFLDNRIFAEFAPR
ncbi:hypothetical protein [Mesorhizobium denitrificans]|uniref:hypothetical protein n=1 Tax=Mesorhizobium denitrificans TaxID=2294114 RepID=UPI0011C06187|nr:hypothetical protein [Mesorhizobium denitrificans]